MSKIKKPSELKTTGLLKVLVYGQPGIGKTTLSLSMPDSLMIDCDGGVNRVESHLLTDTVEVEKWGDIDAVLEEDLSAYKTIIFDTAGKLIDFLTEEVIRQNPKLNAGSGQLTLQGYGARKALFQALLRRAFLMGKHVFFVAHEREDKDNDTRFVRPEIGGSSGNDLIKELDLVGYVQAIGKKRMIHFAPQEKFYAKNGLQLPDQMEIPDTSKGNKFMMKVVARNNEILTERSNRVEEYNELIGLLKTTIDGAEEVEQLNEVTKWAQGLQHVWDSKLQAGQQLKAKAEELGASFNRKKGEYEVKKA